MITNNFAIYSNKILLELVFDILYFPIWWYSKGFYNFIVILGKFLNERQKALAFFVWLKNIGTPMYGQTDLAGKAISVFIRLVQIIFRGVLMLFWLAFVFVLLSIWLFLPILVIGELYYQIT
ncbi:MAG: hypothetical protein UT64_C0006G0020 [Candidatus Falkowbacteria bacterium GW2011_GWF2_39_8]|uniref:Uncharacterized protein n=1 Tax=Candidatus Falkowbacteria bacterium GW2011_GWF2_39_8 TaxID=1618642 RepID=A0A0G0T6V3_9BACT|nr:MAG: hypothetical protein UT64_C0006G0020 [Candidatus Falkowbacteria bacterium GW2011_GWF2_39_8]